MILSKSALVILSLLAPPVFGTRNEARTVVINGKASHGVNFFNGEQVTDWAKIMDFLSNDESCDDTIGLWEGLVIPEAAYYVPGSDEAALVGPDTPVDSFLATKTG